MNNSADALLDECLHADVTPFVFDPAPDTWQSFRDELVSGLGIGGDDIRIVGSARFGFSLRPDRNLKAFGDTSDIDVVVVNANLFDEVWYALLGAVYPRPPLSHQFGGWIENRRNELYTGWISPHSISVDPKIVGTKARPVLNLRMKWFNAFKKAAMHPPRRHEDVTGRLYRTWRHAELYHLYSLASLRKQLARD